jgi:SAM-dependent methyltransferase
MENKYITFSREPFFELARPYITNESKVLDVGCGSLANFSTYFDRKDFFHFDGNEETVHKLKQNFENVAQGSLPNLPYDNKQFDLIHCSHVVEHLTPDILYATLKEFDRCLNNEGYLIISAPLLWEGFYDDLSHIKPYPPAVFKNYLCSKQKISRTRELISNNYEVIKEVYRYFETKNPIYNSINKKGNILVSIYIMLNKLMNKLGFRYLSKTGFTIVLKKQ